MQERIQPNDRYFSSSNFAFEDNPKKSAKSGNDVAQLSASNKRAVEQFLKQGGID